MSTFGLCSSVLGTWGQVPSLLRSSVSPSLKWKNLGGLGTQDGRDGQEGVRRLPKAEPRRCCLLYRLGPELVLMRKRKGQLNKLKTHLKTEVFQILWILH